MAQVLHELTQGQCVYASGYLRTNTGLTQEQHRTNTADNVGMVIATRTRAYIKVYTILLMVICLCFIDIKNTYKTVAMDHHKSKLAT